jgi:hypothetical protein
VRPATLLVVGWYLLLAVTVATWVRWTWAQTDKPPSTPRITYELTTKAGAPTTVKVDGKIRGALRGGRATVRLSGVECARVEPGGAVVIDTLCCEWVRHGGDGVQRLSRRRTFADLPPRLRQHFRAECTQRVVRQEPR